MLRKCSNRLELYQCVANVIFFWQFNIQIYFWSQNLTNIYWMNITVYIYWDIRIYSNIYNVKIIKLNEWMSQDICGPKIVWILRQMNISANKYLNKFEYLNIMIYSNILIFATHWVDYRPSTDKLHYFVCFPKNLDVNTINITYIIVFTFQKSSLTIITWLLTCDMWHVTPDTWHVTTDKQEVVNKMLGP